MLVTPYNVAVPGSTNLDLIEMSQSTVITRPRQSMSQDSSSFF
jgi:hypothetical protein